MNTDQQYCNTLECCLRSGERIQTRNSGVRRLIHRTHDFSSTPLVRVRKTAWRNCIREMEWFLSGSTNINDLHPSVRHWWEPWKDSAGCVRYNYSKQLRHWNVAQQDAWVMYDQVEAMVECLKKHPNSRRNLLTTWNAAEMAAEDCPITNCWGTVIHAFVTGGNRLRLVTYQRSVDVICGLPHNLLQMAAFQLWLCHRTGLMVDGLTWIGGDVHVYDQHIELAERMLKETLPTDAGPQLVYEPKGSEEFKADDFSLSEEYKPLLTDKAEMVV